MRPHVPPEQLWNEFQGDLAFDYHHETYWPALLSMCEERRAQKHERWVKAGKLIGESEIYLKGGDASSVGTDLAVGEEKDIVPPVDEGKAVSESVQEPLVST